LQGFWDKKKMHEYHKKGAKGTRASNKRMKGKRKSCQRNKRALEKVILSLQKVAESTACKNPHTFTILKHSC